ncbi:ATPase [Saccharicrinis sp. GN24d3]|uniref:ATPase n=1 Tax=Saccharicrinis sp. GN24d3 TaxID=3458416 RepID=UPI0040351E7A
MENLYEKGIRWEKNGWMHYSFPACLSWLENAGKKQFGEHFRVKAEDHKILYKLLVYAIGDKENMEKKGLSPDKGIMLSGPVGSGKTAIMSLLNHFLPSEKRYAVQSAREVAFSFARQGYDVLARYTRLSYGFNHGKHIPKVYCFDDVGIEQPVGYYGNECNVMAEILLSRYDHFVSHNMLTHMTTNLSASELEKLYGNRVRSRMREMFNLVSFDREIKDKRK